MKYIYLILTSIILSACSTKSTPVPTQCSSIESQIESLKNERCNNVTSQTVHVLAGTFAFKGTDEHLNEKIKLLELELNECKHNIKK